MAFVDRVTAAREFETQLCEKLESIDFVIKRTGFEDVHPELMEMVRLHETSLSKYLRFQPDGIAIHRTCPISFFFDAKNSQTIERDAYYNYMRLHNSGAYVIVFFLLADGFTIGWNWINKISLIPGERTVSQYAPENRFQVSNDHWILPRKSNGNINPKMSGTPYREVDTCTLRGFAEIAQILPNLKP